jgi:uncharacterized membrane protein YhaH (DUF805 family)
MIDIIKPTIKTQRPARLLSLHGRIGRAHYIANTLGAVLGAGLLVCLLSVMVVSMGELGKMLYIVFSVLMFYCLLPIYCMILTVKRSHDFNFNGIAALLLFIPFVNLLFWFVPGSKSDNHYGPVPPAPSTGIKVVAVLIPILLIAGYLAMRAQYVRENAVSSTPSESNKLQQYTP